MPAKNDDSADAGHTHQQGHVQRPVLPVNNGIESIVMTQTCDSFDNSKGTGGATTTTYIGHNILK